MKLALLGPASSDQALRSAAEALLARHEVDKVLYLGVDGAMDRVVQGWAQELVGREVGDAGIWARAPGAARDATGEEVFAYVGRERQRRRLRVFEALPGPESRVVELLHGKWVLCIGDRSLLDEEDMLPMTVIAFGHESAQVHKVIGGRHFVSPGSAPEAGILVISEEPGALALRFEDPAGALLREVLVPLGQASRLSIAD